MIYCFSEIWRLRDFAVKEKVTKSQSHKVTK